MQSQSETQEMQETPSFTVGEFVYTAHFDHEADRITIEEFEVLSCPVEWTQYIKCKDTKTGEECNLLASWVSKSSKEAIQTLLVELTGEHSEAVSKLQRIVRATLSAYMELKNHE